MGWIAQNRTKNEPMYMCEECGYSSKKKTNLERHKKAIHQDKDVVKHPMSTQYRYQKKLHKEVKESEYVIKNKTMSK